MNCGVQGHHVGCHLSRQDIQHLTCFPSMMGGLSCYLLLKIAPTSDKWNSVGLGGKSSHLLCMFGQMLELVRKKSVLGLK